MSTELLDGRICLVTGSSRGIGLWGSPGLLRLMEGPSSSTAERRKHSARRWRVSRARGDT